MELGTRAAKECEPSDPLPATLEDETNRPALDVSREEPLQRLSRLIMRIHEASEAKARLVYASTTVQAVLATTMMVAGFMLIPKVVINLAFEAPLKKVNAILLTTSYFMRVVIGVLLWPTHNGARLRMPSQRAASGCCLWALLQLLCYIGDNINKLMHCHRGAEVYSSSSFSRNCYYSFLAEVTNTMASSVEVVLLPVFFTIIAEAAKDARDFVDRHRRAGTEQSLSFSFWQALAFDFQACSSEARAVSQTRVAQAVCFFMARHMLTGIAKVVGFIIQGQQGSDVTTAYLACYSLLKNAALVLPLVMKMLDISRAEERMLEIVKTALDKAVLQEDQEVRFNALFYVEYLTRASAAQPLAWYIGSTPLRRRPLMSAAATVVAPLISFMLRRLLQLRESS